MSGAGFPLCWCCCSRGGAGVLIGLFCREDHKPTGVSDSDWSQGGRWEEPADNMMSAWEVDIEDNEHEESGSSNDSYENSDNSDCDGDGEDYGYGNIYGENHGRAEDEEGAGESKSSRQELFADRAARAAIMGIESGERRQWTTHSRLALVVCNAFMPCRQCS